jgi:paraquat-inducible protein A
MRGRLHPNGLAARASGLDRLLGPLIALAGVLLVAGWLLPIMTVERFVFLSQRVSILDGAAELWEAGRYGLFAILVGFSIAFPAFKLIVAGYLWFAGGLTDAARRRLLGVLDALGRWSMLDVFVVAVIVVAAQLSIVSDIQLHGGIYSFAAAVVLSMLVIRRLTSLAQA